jgi:hypothetical protein
LLFFISLAIIVSIAIDDIPFDYVSGLVLVVQERYVLVLVEVEVNLIT